LAVVISLVVVPLIAVVVTRGIVITVLVVVVIVWVGLAIAAAAVVIVILCYPQVNYDCSSRCVRKMVAIVEMVDVRATRARSLGSFEVLAIFASSKMRLTAMVAMSQNVRKVEGRG
jgi:predicted membrane protein